MGNAAREYSFRVPNIINHSGFLTLSESGCGSRNECQSVSSASLISSPVRWRMNTGLPRHLMITYPIQSASDFAAQSKYSLVLSRDLRRGSLRSCPQE